MEREKQMMLMAYQHLCQNGNKRATGLKRTLKFNLLMSIFTKITVNLFKRRKTVKPVFSSSDQPIMDNLIMKVL